MMAAVAAAPKRTATAQAETRSTLKKKKGRVLQAQCLCPLTTVTQRLCLLTTVTQSRLCLRLRCSLRASLRLRTSLTLRQRLRSNLWARLRSRLRTSLLSSLLRQLPNPKSLFRLSRRIETDTKMSKTSGDTQ